MHVIITGATGGLGSELCKHFLKSGNHVTGISRQESSNVQDFSDRFLWQKADLTKADECAQAFDNAVQHFGAPRLVVACAGGIGPKLNIVDSGSGHLQDMLALNLETSYNTVVSALRCMDRGAIVTISAQSALDFPTGRAAYAIANAAVIALTKAASKEALQRNVTVNTIAPNILDTPENREWGSPEDQKTWIGTSEVAALLEFLASEGGAAVTGTIFEMPEKSASA